MENSNTQPTAYIISEKLLKQYGNLSHNVGIDRVLPYLLLAQEYFFEPVLGVPLLTELKIQVSTNTLTEANKALILKIAPALALYTDYLAVRSMAYQINDKGVTKSSSENSESVNEKEPRERAKPEDNAHPRRRAERDLRREARHLEDPLRKIHHRVDARKLVEHRDTERQHNRP